MSLQRILSILLLFSYGIPAGLGPFWHQHHHGSTQRSSRDHECCSGSIDLSISRGRADVDCCDPSEQVCGCTAHDGNLSRDAEKLAAPSTSTGHLIGHSSGEATAVDDSSDQPFTLLSVSANIRCQGNCAICAFYAQSQTSSVESIRILSGSLVEWSITRRTSTEAHWATGFSARGPPSSMLC